MVGLIFGIIFLFAGIITGICLIIYTKKHEPEYEMIGYNFKRDANGERIVKNPAYTDRPYKKYGVASFGLGAFLGLLLAFLGCIANVSTGTTGVVTTFGKIEEYTLDSGFHMVAPWNKVTEIDTTVNEINFTTPAYTKDSQTVDLQITVQYRISTVDTFAVVRDNGIKETKEKIEGKLENRIMSSAKSIVSSKKADDLLTNRSELVTELATSINSFADEYYVIVSAVNLTNIDFTDEYEAAVAAKVAQQQAYEKALIEQQQALAQAENEKNIKLTQAEAEAEVATIQAEADLAVQKINADAAEYTGKKEAAVVLNRLAGINGWNVVLDEETGLYKLYNSDGTAVTETQRQEGVKRLIEYYYTQSWDGKLPETLVTEDDINSILIGG